MPNNLTAQFIGFFPDVSNAPSNPVTDPHSVPLIAERVASPETGLLEAGVWLDNRAAGCDEETVRLDHLNTAAYQAE